MRIQNLNPDRNIGASSWFVEFENHNVLLDAGTHPKLEGRASLPLYDLVKDKPLDAIVLSHCHHDHVGSLPVALQHFPNAHVLMTELSYFLVERVLHNSVNVMMRQREELGIREYPLFTHDYVDEIASMFQGFKYNRAVEWASFQKTRAGFTSPTVEFFDAGHTLGSAGVMVRGAKETLFFTGDVCFQDQTILKGARFEDIKADVLIMETTRGNREVPAGQTRETELKRLGEAIIKVQERKGSVLLPTFALGRTQEILTFLALLMKEGRLKHQPIYIGGLGRVFTEIYDLEAHRTHRSHSNLQLREALNLNVLDRKQIDKMKNTGGRIYVVTAGMMSENTAAHDLAARMAGDENHAIFFVGYTDPETPGGRMRVAKKGETFVFSPSAGEVTLNCEMDAFDLTAHANRDELLDFVGKVEPRTVILGHGDDEARAWFAQAINARHPKIKVLQPGPGEAVDV
ncbi:MAG: Cft2 family processing exonuclease [Verrucomicrobia bacterium]|jgi:Cft2 family RNA processing exonuclease|nr:Cft2 family processing exonuclease [Verrucomicrobiota bacterium]